MKNRKKHLSVPIAQLEYKGITLNQIKVNNKKILRHAFFYFLIAVMIIIIFKSAFF